MKVSKYFFLILILSVLAYAQTDSCRRYGIVRVLIDDASPLTGLTTDNFHIRISGNDGKFEVLKPANRQRLLLLLDNSSLQNGNSGEAAYTAVSDIITFAKPETQLALINFGSQQDQVFGFEHTRQELAARLSILHEHAGQLTLGKEIPVRDQLLKAAKVFGEPMYGDTIFLITRGSEAGNQASVSTTVKELQERGIRVFILYFLWQPSRGFGVVTSSFNPAAYDFQDLIDVARLTGGATYPIIPQMASERYDLIGGKLQKFRQVVAAFYNSMVHFYVLTSHAPIAEQDWKVETKLPEGFKQTVTLYYPSHLIACTH